MQEAAQFATYPSLRGRSVLITGGAAGIGRSMVEAFVFQGAKVVFLDKDENAAGAVVEELRAAAKVEPNALMFIPCDVTDITALKTAIAETQRAHEGLKVLINNAGNDERHVFDELTPEAWDDCMAVNLKHQFFATQTAYPAIAAAGGGSIICLGSIAWLNNTTGMVGYTTAKAGIHGLVRTLARQLGPMRIRVNALVPGWTMTERQLDRWVDEHAEHQIERAQCLPGRVMPEDVARMALFLAADDSAMCTKRSFVVDGGWI